MGVTGQALLVTGMVVAPMLWPQVMPTATVTLLVPHAPAGRAKGRPAAKLQAARLAPRKTYRPTGFFQPAAVPARIEIVSDLHVAVADTTGGGPGIGVDGGTGDGSDTAVVRDVLHAGDYVPRPTTVRPVELPKPAVARVTATPGGRVRPPRLVYRIEPKYPQLARQAHVEGVVKLSGVISTGGRIAELTCESGNPLLVPAAVDAVRQWLYEPTLLNNVPVEVATTIVVTFTLSR